MTPEQQLASFLAKYEPEVSEIAEAARSILRHRYPHALELIYDNYNALVIGFGPTARASDAIFSIALYPKWVSMFFLQAKALKDPAHLLQGSGTVARHIRLASASMLDEPAVLDLMHQAVAKAAVPFDSAVSHQLIIKSVSAKQRERKPKSAIKAIPKAS